MRHDQTPPRHGTTVVSGLIHTINRKQTHEGAWKRSADEGSCRRRHQRNRRPLLQKLVERGHEVVGLTRRQAGADRFCCWSAAVADVLDTDALMTAVRGLRVDGVVS